MMKSTAPLTVVSGRDALPLGGLPLPALWEHIGKLKSADDLLAVGRDVAAMVEAGEVQKLDAVDRLWARGIAVGIHEEELQTGLCAAFNKDGQLAIPEADAGISVSTHGATVLTQVFNFFGRFVAFPSKEAHTAAVLWVIHTHRMDLWDSTPRIAFLSPEPGSGKTRALEILELLVPRPICAVNMSSAALFRCVASDDGLTPTILHDEVDALFNGAKAKENEDVRALLNAGHRRGQKTYRAVARGNTGKVEIEAIEAYSAAALAGLGFLPDTLAARAVGIRMRRRHENESIEPYRRRIHGAQGEMVRAAIEVWTGTWPDQIDWPELPPQIQDRDADVWEPLIAIADLAGGDWPVLARKAAVTLTAQAKETDASLGVRLLTDLRAIFDAAGADDLQTSVLLERLRAVEESPWADLKGKPIDERRLARMLKGYSVKSHVIWFGAKQARGYRSSDLADAWGRYLPRQGGKNE